MITAAEREAALRRAAAKRVLRTRFIANSVPPHVLRWLIAHEEAVMVGGAAPAMPHDVLDWFGARGIPFAGNGDEAGMREVAFRAPVDAPRQCSGCAC